MMDAIRRYPGLTIASLIAFAILLKLGFWQVDRLHQKEALLAAIDAGLNGEIQPLPVRIDDPEAWSYKRVLVRGRFDHARELHLFAPSVDGAVGYHILTPLLRDDGGVLLVDRGWVPEAMLDPAKRPMGQVAGDVVLKGVARLPGKLGPFVPDPELARNHWYGIDLAAMGKAAGYDFAPLIVEADKSPNPGGLPVGGQTRVDIPNNHLGYAITWFGLALSLLVIYVVYVRRRQ